MLLCDAAQVAEGKLYVLGGGWSVIGPQPMPMGVALKVDVDWHEASREHHWELFLEDADGQPVMIDTPDGKAPVELRGEFSVQLPQGVPEGSPVDVPMAINVGPLPLVPGSRYNWRFVVDGESLPGANVAFATRPAEEPPADA
jgi:hypothetical protein